MLMTIVFSVGNWLNRPASAPTSMMVFIFDNSIEFWMNCVSMRVRYFPMRVLAAFSQCVASEKSGLEVSAAAKIFTGISGLSVWFHFNI